MGRSVRHSSSSSSTAMTNNRSFISSCNHLIASSSSSSNIGSDPAPDHHQHHALVGRRVRKSFPSFGIFEGTIVSFNSRSQLYKVLYDDGDREDMEPHEVVQFLLGMQKHPPSCPRATDLDFCNDKEVSPSPLSKKGRGRAVAELSAGEDRIPSRRTWSTCDLADEASCCTQRAKRRRKNDWEDQSAYFESCSSADAMIKQVEQEEKLGPVNEKIARTEDADIFEAKLHTSECSIASMEVPSPLPLPPSSEDLLVPPESALDCLATYSFLRSFSQALFLSPFSIKEYQQAISSETPTLLMDSLHLCLLQALRRHLERLSKAGSELARACLRQPDWTLLDNITWPSHLLGFLYMYGFQKQFKQKFSYLDIEYYKVAVETKFAVLNFLCDHVMDTEEIRVALAMRSLSDVQRDKVDQEPEDLLHLELVEGRLARKQCSLGPDALEGETVEVGEAKGDENTDECMLCGMNGDLICCDGCPAAYHSRCVGVSKGFLPQGDWFCPECVEVQADGKQLEAVGSRGADLLFMDSCGRSFFTTCGYLLVIDPTHSSRLHYYSCKDLPIVLEWLEVAMPACDFPKNILLQQFDIVERGNSTKSCTDLNTMSEESSPVEHSKESSLECLSIIDGESELPGGVNFCTVEGKIYYYTNFYALGDMAATAAANLAMRKRVSNDQLDVFTKVQTLFCWPNNDKKLMELPRERCGWCFLCSNPNKKKACFLNQAARLLAAGASRVPGGILPTDFGSGHLPAIAGYLLYMESSLNSLLLGLWEDPVFQMGWREQVRQARSIYDLKTPLLQLESCLRPVALTGKWFSAVEDAPLMSFRSSAASSSLQSRAQKKGQHKLSNVEAQSVMWLPFWKRKKLSKKVFQWHLLPSQVTRKAGRQGGLRKLKGLVYSEAMDAPRRNKHCAWQSRVEAASSVSQLALQILM